MNHHIIFEYIGLFTVVLIAGCVLLWSVDLLHFKITREE